MNTQPRKIVKTHQIRSSRGGRLLLLIPDKSEEIATIEWTATGKVRRITRTPQSRKPDLEFRYDALGNRVSKTVIAKPSGERTTTYYVRDAQGTTLATYTEKSGDLRLSEQHLYGAKRLGMRSSNLLVATTNSHNGNQEDYSAEKRYELTNHLGNVLAVVSDQKKEDGTAQILSLTDYYPYGMEMDGRKYVKDVADGGYRYGFTGHEKEFDMANDVYTTDYRLLDARVGRWLSVDPLADKYAGMSSYNYCLNNPVRHIDPTGTYVPNEEGHLVAEEGDNVETLAGYLSISVDEAKNLMTSQGYDIFKEGDVLKLDNPVTRDLSADHTEDRYGYNCWGSTLTCIEENYIQARPVKYDESWGHPYPQTSEPQLSLMDVPIVFDDHLIEKYKQIEPKQAEFMKTAIRFAKGYENCWNMEDWFADDPEYRGGTSHGCVYYGASKDGTIYVYTKNGDEYPKIMKLNDLQIQYKSEYGDVIGIGGGSGFYLYTK